MGLESGRSGNGRAEGATYRFLEWDSSQPGSRSAVEGEAMPRKVGRFVQLRMGLYRSQSLFLKYPSKDYGKYSIFDTRCEEGKCVRGEHKRDWISSRQFLF